jgi:rSAM/selenodomain-associated transferase 1
MNIKGKMDFTRGVVALFAKTPRRGAVKTRIQPLLGEDGALSLHKSLIQFVFNRLDGAGLCPVELWVAVGDGRLEGDSLHEEVFTSICNIKNIKAQSEGDLGVRMATCARQVLQRADYVVLVGADCPSVDADYLRRALGHLEAGADIVIGPAEDGGYVLLGLRTVPGCLFEDVPWGTARVLETTRANLLAQGLEWVELEPRWDVDRPEDLPRWEALRRALPSAGKSQSD